MTRSTKLLASLLFCALGVAFAAAALDGQVPTESEPTETESDCEGRVLPRTGKWAVSAAEMQGPRLKGVGEQKTATMEIDNVSNCGMKIEVKMPKSDGASAGATPGAWRIVFEFKDELRVPGTCTVDCEEGEESVMDFVGGPVTWALKGLSAEEARVIFDWQLGLPIHRDEQTEHLLFTYKAEGLPNPPFKGVTWLLVVESETQIRSFIYGGFNWQHHEWAHFDEFQG